MLSRFDTIPERDRRTDRIPISISRVRRAIKYQDCIDWKLLSLANVILCTYLQAAAGSSNDRLLCHVHRHQVTQCILLQQLFSVHAITRGDQCGNSKVAVGAQ